MESTIAFCGLDCSTCPIHLATLKENPEAKARLDEIRCESKL